MKKKIDLKIEEIRALLLAFKEGSNSLYQGASGVSLFFSYDTENAKSNENFEQSLAVLFERINNKDTISTFCGGYAGIGWYLNHLIEKELLDESSFVELLTQIDEISYNSALLDLEENNHDFLHGAIGKCLYLSKRIHANANVKRYLKDLLNKISEISFEQDEQLYWLDYKIADVELNEKSNGINISLSHGLSSKIVLFSKFLKNNIEPELSKELLIKSVNFLLQNKNLNKNFSSYTHSIDIDKQNNTNYQRMAWCYGDLGISVALYQAGQALNNESIKNQAIAICLKTTEWTNKEKLGVSNPGICHGTAGIAHIYNRMHFYTKNVKFKAMADHWINETLNMSFHESGLAGFKSCLSTNENSYKNDYSFLEGITGIGLVLLNHISNEVPIWDECLMLS